MNTTQLSALIRTTRTHQLSRSQVKELFALSCGVMMTLRSMGFKFGDARYNDASIGNLEIQKYAREVYDMNLNTWWREVLK